MTNTVVLSAMTVFALTAITLTTLKYRHDENYVEVDGEDDENVTDVRYNPKFYLHANNHSTVKRSVDDNVQYSIVDTDLPMVDEAKRAKVKQVQVTVCGIASIPYGVSNVELLSSRFFLIGTDDDACLEQLQALCVGQERVEAHF
jgi:hypothetical protein